MIRSSPLLFSEAMVTHGCSRRARLVPARFFGGTSFSGVDEIEVELVEIPGMGNPFDGTLLPYKSCRLRTYPINRHRPTNANPEPSCGIVQFSAHRIPALLISGS